MFAGEVQEGTNMMKRNRQDQRRRERQRERERESAKEKERVVDGQIGLYWVEAKCVEVQTNK